METLFFVLCCLYWFSYGDCYIISYKTYYFKQKVDHFSYTNTDMFRQRYLVNFDHYEPFGNGTLLVYTGNEGDITMFAKNTGFMWEHARTFRAALIFIEHRYYGHSLPYGDKSFKNITYLGYLTTEQALADYAVIIEFLKTSMPNSRKAPAVVFGGSYGGILAAWMRIKYPHIVCGAIASSAPILAFGGSTNLVIGECCHKFAETVTRDFLSQGGFKSAQTIRNSWAILRRIYNETAGMEKLIKNFHLCESSFDIDQLIEWLSSTWNYIAMIDYPYPTNFLEPLPAFPVKEAAKFLQNPLLPDEEILFNLYQAASVFHNYTGQAQCFNLTQTAGSYLGLEAWSFQECTEMVSAFCTNGVTDMFEPKKWNYTSLVERCFKKYGITPDAYKPIWMYGANKLQWASNIVFTNGLLDPWYTSGILKSITNSVVAIIMEGAAHHLDLRSSNVADPPSVVDARQIIIKYMWKFIIEEKIKRSKKSTNFPDDHNHYFLKGS